MIERTLKYPELNQHAFVSTRCLLDDEGMKEGITDVVVIFAPSLVEPRG